MKQTKDNCFIDTNILVYCYTKDEPLKKEKALLVVNKPLTFISTQVLNEISNILKKKFDHSYADIIETINELSTDFNIYINKPVTIIKACNIAKKYHFSFYDSLIIAAALECNCKIIFSEDMQHKQIIENTITIINPFL